MPKFKLPILTALVAILLSSPALGVGLQFDDYVHERFIQANPHLSTVSMGLFRFHAQNPARAYQLMEQGILPWWTFPDMHLAFWRPLSAMTHWLDYQLWPDQPALMHAHSLLWLGLLIAMVTLLYRQLFALAYQNTEPKQSLAAIIHPPHKRNQRKSASSALSAFYLSWGLKGYGMTPAVMAAWLYALDDAHGFAVGWLANRNIILATFFGCATILSYHKWRYAGWQGGKWLTPLLLLLGLLSTEAAIATLGYLVAYALYLDQAPKLKRALALGPCLLVVMIWQLVYRWGGYGAFGTAYSDPFHEPGLYLLTLLERGPILLAGQFIWPSPEIYKLLFGPLKVLFWGLAVILAGIIIALFSLTWGRADNNLNLKSSQPRPSERQLAHFWLLGMGLSLLPAVVIFPANRMLFFVGLGAMALIAQFLHRYPPHLPSRASLKNKLSTAQTGYRLTVCLIGWLFILIHFIIAPLLLPLNAYSPTFLGNLEAASQQLPIVEQQHVIIVSAPSFYHASLIPYLRQRTGQAVPDLLRVLATTPYPVEVTRLEAQTLAIRPQGGFLLGLESLFRNQSHQLALRQRFDLAGMSIEIADLTPWGTPAEVYFQFDVPLEDNSLTWFYWQADQYKTFTPPPIGQTVILKAW